MSSAGRTADRPGAGIVRRVARSATGLLPFPRDDAAQAVLRDLRALIVGAPPGGIGHAEALARHRLARGRAALAAGDAAGAECEADAVLASRPRSVPALRLKLDAERATGSPGGGFATLLNLRRLADAPDLARLERDLAGQAFFGFRDARVTIDDAVVQAEGALRLLVASGVKDPIILAFHPASPSPYLELLYARALACGMWVVPVRRIEDADALVPVARSWGARLVVHLHWLSWVLDDASAGDADARIAAFTRALDDLADRGVRLAWTVHNILPHDAVLPAEEARLRREVVARATVVHALAATTAVAVAPFFSIPPEKLLHVPHPGFRGFYPDWVSRDDARLVLGIGPSEPLIALVGSLKPYKGIEELLDALPIVAARRPGVRLFIGGTPDPGPAMDRLLDRALATPGVLLHPRRIPDDRLQHVLRAADAVVLPYRRTLNSAALLLALSFERAVVVPALPGMLELVTPEVATTFSPDDPAALAEAILAALDLPPTGVASAARRIIDGRDPAILSERFADGLRQALERATGG